MATLDLQSAVSSDDGTADTIGTVLGIGAAAGVAAHAVTTNIRKRKQIRETMDESVSGPRVKRDKS